MVIARHRGETTKYRVLVDKITKAGLKGPYRWLGPKDYKAQPHDSGLLPFNLYLFTKSKAKKV